MAQATSISLSKFTAVVQAAVKAAVQRHPKFQIAPPTQVAMSYLIRGIPVAESIVANATLAETQAFAADVASQIAGSGPQVSGLQAGTTPEGAVYSRGNHVIIGIPAVTDVLVEK